MSEQHPLNEPRFRSGDGQTFPNPGKGRVADNPPRIRLSLPTTPFHKPSFKIAVDSCARFRRFRDRHFVELRSVHLLAEQVCADVV
jgi:hypothetical protein